MKFLLYGALILSQSAVAARQYSMKKCGSLAPGVFNSICINLARSSLCLVVSLIIWLFVDGKGTSATGVLISIAAGIGTAFNLLTWILSSQRVSLTLLEGACAVGSLILPLFLAPYLYGGETVSLIQWIGTFLLIISLLLFAGNNSGRKEKKSLFVSVILVLVCALSTTVAAVTKKLYTFHVTAKGEGSVEFFTLIGFVTILVTFALLFVFYYRAELGRVNAYAESGVLQRVEFPYRRAWVFILIAAVSLYVSELFATYASDLPSAIYYPATKAMNVLGCFLLDAIVFKEKTTVKKVIGLVLLVTAVILVNI